MGASEVDIEPWVSEDVDYLTADEEEKFVIAQANAPLDDEGHFLDDARAGALQRQLRPGARLAASTTWTSRRGRR